MCLNVHLNFSLRTALPPPVKSPPSPAVREQKLIALTVVAVLVTVAVAFLACVATIKAVMLFFGLEGTALLASALSPPTDMEVPKQKGILKRVSWWFTEGRGWNYPVHYNPVFFYGGLFLLALSMVLSIVSG